MAETAVKEKESVFQFGKKERKLLTDPLNDNNPITVQVLAFTTCMAKSGPAQTKKQST